MRPADTIVAPATPATAPAARAIVRISGDRAFAMVDAIAADAIAMPHASAVDRVIRLADGVDVPTTVYSFLGPRSATGEDVCELHLPGSPLFVRLAIARLLALGARVAAPGEFTARAFFHGKLDLARAEGVAATIAAANRRELDAARQLLAGELARRVAPITAAIADLLALVEAGIDFADEAVDFLPDATLRERIVAIDDALAALSRDTARIERLAHEPRIVLTGRPNAGKSTLLNALAGHDRAVVSDVAGTTRDALSARITLRRGVVTLVDTAGLEASLRRTGIPACPNASGEADLSEKEPLRGAARGQAGMPVLQDADDSIEQQMRDVALSEVERADAVVRVVALDAPTDVEPAGLPADLIVYTKLDLAAPPAEALAVCARTGANLDALRDALDALAFGGERGGGTLALNARHVAAVDAARTALAEATAAIDHGHEFVAAGLRAALDAVGGVTGTVSPDDVLGRIFGSFCIGK